ncbi:alpha-D-ribose 1-methylphosphonate 5-triphosphate diphosphatase [Rhodobacterales bacterium 59_46_T64]|nr:alpha-D-ribose 1-methylphosphonate 5-triphosphate diphosphatase [Rhodobacterales bacterium 59_46_T64]
MRLHLTGAEILQDGVLAQGRIGVDAGKFTDASGGKTVDLRGFRMLPGMIDMHGDGFERHIAPRRGAMRDMRVGVLSTEAELAANGFTTAVLAQFYSWEGGMRGPEAADRFCTALAATRGTCDTDLRLQLRFEVNLLDHYAAFETFADQVGCDYVVFNDHLPHDKLAAGKRPPRLVGTALKSGRNPEVHLKLMQDLHARRDEVPAAIAGLAARLGAKGYRLGSHDERTAEARAAWRDMGVRIAEFPETFEAAEAARAGDDGIVLGAPNVMRGGSHSGNVSAVDLIRDGLCDALASDYHYPAARVAALQLAEEIGLAKAWDLVSAGPARLLGLTDRGRIAAGLRADFVVIDPETGRLGATFAQGRATYMSGEVAARFIS